MHQGCSGVRLGAHHRPLPNFNKLQLIAQTQFACVRNVLDVHDKRKAAARIHGTLTRTARPKCPQLLVIRQVGLWREL
jgi:hypothetical protein